MMVRISVFVILFVFLQVITVQCGRFGGGGRSSFSRSYSRPSYSRPSYHPPAYHPPAYHPPAYHPPAYHPPAYHPPAYNHPSPPAYHPHAPKPSPPPAHGSGTTRPIGFVIPSAPVGPAKHETSVQRAPHGTGTSGSETRPIGFINPTHPVGPPKQSPSHNQVTVRPLGFDTFGSNQHGQPVGSPKKSSMLDNSPPHALGGTATGTVRPLGFPTSGSNHPNQQVGPPKQVSSQSNPPPYNSGNYGQNPPPYNPHYNTAGYGPPPAYNPGGYHTQSGYHHPQGGYSTQGGGGVTIINNNNVNNNHHGSYGGGYGGWPHTYYSPPVYTTHDTGSTALGFYLGYSLGRISTPTYHYHSSYYDNYGYTPRYDHYTVHHYYHNKDAVPKVETIEPNAIVGCVGDSGSFCPANTTSLCTNNGAVMCVASAVSTVPCSNEKQTNCVRSSIPCKDNNAPECKQSNNETVTITIPCISTANVYGDISYVNNSIVISNHTNQNVTSPNAVSISASNGNMTTMGNITSLNVTTPVNASTATNTTNARKERAQTFCVTILALPAERKLTDGEKLFGRTKSVFSNFLVKTLGID